MPKISFPVEPPALEMARSTRIENMVFVSGQVGRLADGTMPLDFNTQARIVFDNLSSALAGVGANLSNVVKITCFLAHREDAPAYRELRKKVFPTEPPASSTVLVAGLVNPDARIEVEAIAVLEPAQPSI